LVCSSQNRGTFAHHFQKEEIPSRVLPVDYQKIEYIGRVSDRIPAIRPIPAILPLERATMDLPFHELLLQPRKFNTAESFCEEIPQLIF
jgi:hypothetical protein